MILGINYCAVLYNIWFPDPTPRLSPAVQQEGCGERCPVQQRAVRGHATLCGGSALSLAREKRERESDKERVKHQSALEVIVDRGKINITRGYVRYLSSSQVTVSLA